MTVELSRFSLPLAEPLETAHGTIDHREGFLVTLRRAGTSGWGEATPLPGWTESLEACREALAGVESASEASLATLEEHPATRHGLELARCDLAAKERGKTLYRYLGGDSGVDTVPVNATVGSETDVTAAVREVARAGFSCCKLKVGRQSLSTDLERIATARRTAPDIDLRVDANGSWDAEMARTAIDRLADLEVSLLEQPLPADKVDAHADLRGKGVPIALDETLVDTNLETIAEREAADVVVAKPMVLGGPEATLSLAREARSHGIDTVVSSTIDGLVGRLGALHIAAAIDTQWPAGVATADRLAADLGRDPVTISDGRATLPAGDGIGLTGDWRDICT